MFTQMETLSMRVDDIYDRQSVFQRKQDSMRGTLDDVSRTVRDMALSMDEMRPRQEEFYQRGWPSYP